MSCPIYDESPDLLMDFAAGKLDFESKQRMDVHLAKCEICSDALAAQAMVWKALDEWDAAPVSMDFDAKLYARIETQHATVWGNLKSLLLPAATWFRWQPAIGMAGVGALFVAVFLLQTPAPSDHGGGARVDGVRMESHEIEQAERALDDVEMVDKLFTENKGEAQTL